MADIIYTSQGGGEGGGLAVFVTTRPPGCNLLLCEVGLIDQLDMWCSRWEQKYRVGLFQNDSYPSLTWTMANVTPANFSGYSGLKLSFGWQAPSINNTRAVTVANALTWTHNGGATGNFIYGYYVVNDTGVLQWAERFCPAPLSVWKFGQALKVIPTFTLRNDIPE